MSYEQVVIVGNVGREPELRYTPAGVAVTDMSVAASRKWKGEDGEVNEHTTWYRVTVWRKQAEIVCQYLAKGDQVMVQAKSIKASPYKDKNGEPAASLDLVADRVVFLRNGKSGGRQHSDEEAQEFAHTGVGSDIPF